MLKEIENLGISSIEAKELIKHSKNIKKDIKLLKKGYPVQYLIGYVNFYGNNILVNKNVLIPRYETETLIEKTINYIKKYNFNKPNILDLCTGSGAIAITLKKEIVCDMTISDISVKALKIAKQNLKYNNVSTKIIKSNLFNKINEMYDIIITNPPYVSKSEELSKEVKKEPKKALYSDDNGMKHIKKIIKESNKYLKNKSILAIEIGSNQGKELITYAKELYPKSKIIVEKDLCKRDRYLFIFNNCE